MSDRFAEAAAHLREIAELDRFCIFRSKPGEMGQIVYINESGQPFGLADDNDDRVKSCVALLESLNCPVFGDDDHDVMLKHFEQLAKKTSHGTVR